MQTEFFNAMARNEKQIPVPDYKHVQSSQKQMFHYFIIVLVLATLVASILALVNTYQLKKFLIPKQIDVNDFLKKLTAHSEAKSYTGVAPLNIVQINSNNLANLQSQISGLDASYFGSFIVQYNDRVVLYDYSKDTIRGTVALQEQVAKLPADFFDKFNKHKEVLDLKNEQPIGGQLDSSSLSTLKQQFPDVYKDAKEGDFLLRYKAKLIIYDYNADKIVNIVSLK